MDVELLKDLGLDPKKDLKELLEELEDKQGEFFERLETVSDEARREELNDLLSKIDQQISQLKAQMKAMSSGIVIDTGAASTDSAEAKKKEAERQEAEKAQAKKAEEAKKAQEAAKIQELKRKEAERRRQAKQAAAAAAAAAANTQNTAPQQGASNQQPAASNAPAANKQASSGKQPAANAAAQPTGNVQNGPKDLQQGLVLYTKKSFTGAFAIFKPLAEKGDVTAQYMLGSMYHRGEGTPKDTDRAKFWMEKAADAGDTNAQYDYAIMLLSDVNNQDITMGLYYLGMAAASDHKDAVLKYVELAQNADDVNTLGSAVQYCKKLIATTEDSFDKQKHTATLNNLNAKYKVALKKEQLANRASKLTIIGAIISIISIISIFLGVHQGYFIEETFLGNFPSGLQKFLFNGWIDITASSGSTSAAGLVILGWIFRTAGNNPARNTKASAMDGVCVAFRYIAIAGHVLFSILAGTKLFGNFFMSMITIGVCVLIGKGLGFVLGKILRTK